MNKKYIVAALIVIITAGVAGFAGRNFIADSQVTKIEQDESLSGIIDKMMLEANGTQIKTGEFVDADAFHKASGSAAIYTTNTNPVLVFDESFEVRPGPDLVVYLSPNNVAAGEDLGDFISLNELKNDSDAQAYSLPENYDEFQSVVIWCRAFGVEFGAADLKTL